VPRSFIDRAAIYRTPALHAAWEAAARANLAAELSPSLSHFGPFPDLVGR
jgi:predicted metal-dependent HD superfamily phosphohydrolase